MKSYVKIYGPPVLKAIKTLEKIAIDMPEVCIMDTVIEASPPQILSDDDSVSNYFGGITEIPKRRCSKIISKSGEKVGEYDFYFEWFKTPNQEDLNGLIEKIDNALLPLGCRYSITTKTR